MMVSVITAGMQLLEEGLCARLSELQGGYRLLGCSG